MSFTTTAAPSRARRRAITRPIPEPAPVTTAVFRQRPFESITSVAAALRSFSARSRAENIGPSERTVGAMRLSPIVPSATSTNADSIAASVSRKYVSCQNDAPRRSCARRGAAAVAEVVRPPGLVRKRARPGLERIEVAPVLAHAVVRPVLVREDDFFVEEQSVGLRLDGGPDLRAPRRLRSVLLAARFLDAHAEVDDDEVRVGGEVGRRPTRRVLHAATVARPLGPSQRPRVPVPTTSSPMRSY